MRTTDTVLVSFDFTHGVDKSVLVVGRQLPRHSDEVINAFQGEEAYELWKKLTTKREVGGGD